MRKKRERCSLQQEEIKGCLVLRARGRLQESVVLKAIDSLQKQKIVFDLNHLEELKSKDLRILFQLYERLNGGVSVFSEDPDVAMMIIMSGLEKKLKFRSNEEAAINALTHPEEN